MAVAEVLGDGSPDGVSLGRAATEKISFYGATPVVQQEVPADAADATAGSAEEINAVNANLKDLVAELVELGLISQA